MTKKVLHIAFPFFLIANLLFSQVALNFLHSKNTEQHERAVALEKGQQALHNHAEHCKVCSLDTLFNLLLQPAAEINPGQPTPLHVAILKVDLKFPTASFTQDRAPPAVIG